MKSKSKRRKGLQAKKYNLGGYLNPNGDPTKKPAKRVGSRINPDGTESTHLYATETLDGKNWVSFPTLFQNPDGTWVDMSGGPWEAAYKEAKSRGEVIDFGQNKQDALDWGMGGWKTNPYKVDLPTAVRDNTYTPTAAEQQFMNYAKMPPQLQTPFFKDEGAIRATPENEPSFLQSLWEGTPLGMTEEERYRPYDQMSLVDVMAEPLKALKFYNIQSNIGRLPTRAEWDALGGPNPMDMPLAMFNPAAQISFAKEDEAGGLSAFTGIGKIGQVVRDAFNTGDDLLRISAENISKQGQKMTQRQLTQQINKSPIVDLEEAIYNTDVYGVETPGFGLLSRNSNTHYLGQPGGPLVTQLQNQHAEDYGIMAEGFSMRNRDKFNITNDGNELPITRIINYGGVMNDKVQHYERAFYEPGAFVSGSVPQIKPLQVGGELEKFIKNDGSINLDEVARFVGTSATVSPADRFILNEAIAKMGSMGVEFIDYNEFKRAVSNYIPRMTIRSSDKYADVGVSRIFPDASNLERMDGVKFTAEAVIIGEGDLPAPVYSEAGNEMSNYMLDNSSNDRGMHYERVYAEDPFATAYENNKATFGSHSHYRVVRREDEPEISYFLEIQSDALSPGGLSDYNRMIDSGKNANRSALIQQTPVNMGGWALHDFTGQALTRDRTPMGLIDYLTDGDYTRPGSDFIPSQVINENENLFPPFTKEELDSEYTFSMRQKFKNAINALSPKNFNAVFKNSIEPVLIKKYSGYVLPRVSYDGLSGLQLDISQMRGRMNSIAEMLEPGSDFMREAVKSDEAHAAAVEELKNRYRYASRSKNYAYEEINDMHAYVDYKAQDFTELAKGIGNVLSEYDAALTDNPNLSNLMIKMDDVLPLQRIKKEIEEIKSIVYPATNALFELHVSVRRVRDALDISDDDVFPLEDTYLGVTNAFKETQRELEHSEFWAGSIIDGAGSINFEGFEKTMKNLPDVNELADRYNKLSAELEKEFKIFSDKYLPVVPGGRENPVSNIMKKRPERRIIGEALHGPHNNLYNRFPTEETSRKIQNHPAIGEEGAEKYDDVQRKYKNMEKTLRAMGYEPKLVTDKNGNTWWEVKATAGMIHGTAEYDAYWKGGRIGLKKKRKVNKVGSKIKLLKKEGRPHDQAVAMALNMIKD